MVCRIESIPPTLRELNFSDGTFDPIWSEGAIAIAEISWFDANIPDDPRRSSSVAHPAMTTVDDNLRTLESAGYSPVHHFVLPEHAWWEKYYSPLERRIHELKSKSKDHHKVIGFLNGEQKEIDLCRRCAGNYGNIFYIARNATRSPATARI